MAKQDRRIVQVGVARRTDVDVPIRVSKRLLMELKRVADADGIIRISEDDFLKALHGVVEDLSPKAEAAPGPINILEKANKIIYGDREQAYGNPRFNLDTIAQLWAVYLNRKFPELSEIAFFQVSAEDVSQMMILLKTARLIHNPTHVDSLVDQAGYAALQNRIQGQ